jgi:DNA-damage-inducible protein J
MATEPTNFRLDSDAKEAAYAIFDKVGLKPAQAVNLFLRQVALRGGLPFEIKVPNAKTIGAMKELKKGKGRKFKNTRDLYKDLGI